jgi:trans-aconitate 2-methyltransferase
VSADWDARTYHRVAQPHVAWGASVLDRLALRGDETVVDAGCGSGAVTARLLERLPNGYVVAVDRSASMLAEARANLGQAEQAGRVRFVEADLLRIDQLLDLQVDAVLSTATFHWIEDHGALFRALHAVTRTGGQLVAQCGGGNNLAHFAEAADTITAQSPYAPHLRGKRLWRNYYGIDETHQRLHQAAYTEIRVWLEDSPQQFSSAEEFETFCRTVVLSRHVAELPEPLRDAFVASVADEVARREGGHSLDYVRLNLDATA